MINKENLKNKLSTGQNTEVQRKWTCYWVNLQTNTLIFSISKNLPILILLLNIEDEILYNWYFNKENENQFLIIKFLNY